MINSPSIERLKIVFFGTSDVAIPILQALDAENEIVAVVTSPDAAIGRKQIISPSAVAQAATDMGFTIFKPEKVKKNDELREKLEQLNADIFIVVSYGKILPLEVINMPRLKTLNVHFSRLPQYRGAAPIQWALLNGETTTATTIFVLDELMDHGPIVAQEDTIVQSDDTFATLSHRMAQQSAVLLTRLLPQYAAGKIPLREQDHAQATPTGMIHKIDGRIDWTQSAGTIYNRYRAFQTWPGIWTTWQDKTLKILSCHPVIAQADSGNSIESVVSDTSVTPLKPTTPGTITKNSDGRITVQCGESSQLELVTVQLEGQKPTDIKSFTNGRPDFIGQRFQ